MSHCWRFGESVYAGYVLGYVALLFSTLSVLNAGKPSSVAVYFRFKGAKKMSIAREHGYSISMENLVAQREDDITKRTAAADAALLTLLC
ncbi:hypothetical protein BJ878DRAFT_542244 [Calycina marina]|uniref:Uncharacterized protein n=1 Tax=Calycina marina TaxID=1763456 RepID=A0A9P7Z2N1_9HELO|nr:hypothetical protein BJ878DRAFT_542244 [Calycina marina]